MSARCTAELVVERSAARCALPAGHETEHDGVHWQELALIAQAYDLLAVVAP